MPIKRWKSVITLSFRKVAHTGVGIPRLEGKRVDKCPEERGDCTTGIPFGHHTSVRTGTGFVKDNSSLCPLMRGFSACRTKCFYSSCVLLPISYYQRQFLQYQQNKKWAAPVRLQMLPIEIMLWSLFWQNKGIRFPVPVLEMCAAAPVQNSYGQSPHRI